MANKDNVFNWVYNSKEIAKRVRKQAEKRGSDLEGKIKIQVTPRSTVYLTREKYDEYLEAAAGMGYTIQQYVKLLMEEKNMRI